MEIILGVINTTCSGTQVWKRALLHPKSYNITQVKYNFKYSEQQEQKRDMICSFASFDIKNLQRNSVTLFVLKKSAIFKKQKMKQKLKINS